MAPHPTVLLNNGMHMPLLGLGTFADPLLQNADEAEDATYQALKAGYRHIDTAFFYGTEPAVGRGVRKAIAEGICKREDVWVTTKVFPTNFKRDKLIAQAKESNQNLDLGYIDCLLLHFPIPFISFGILEGTAPVLDDETDIHTETYKALEEVQEMGITKTIGVSNYSINLLNDLLKVAKIVPVCNQVESHPYVPNTKVLNYCKRKGIVVVAYSPFGGGKVDASRPWKQLNDLPEEPVVVEIAKKHNVSSRLVLARFHVERDVVVLAKSYNKERLEQNAKVFDFKLDSIDMDQLLAMESGRRLNNMPGFEGHRYYPYGPDDGKDVE